MFRWFFFKKNIAVHSETMRREFAQMLESAHRVMFLSCGAFLRLQDAETVKSEVFTLDKQINKAERTIRKELFLKSVVNHNFLPFTFMLMSVVKDAERLGDIAKNFYDLAVEGEAPSDGMKDQMNSLYEVLLTDTKLCCEIFVNDDKEAAKELIYRTSELEDTCDEQIQWYLQKRQNAETADVVYVLALRYFKRYAAHLRNITSAVVQPLHKIDFTGKIVKKYREENC